MLLEIANMSISFQRFHGGLTRKKLTPVSDIMLNVKRGEIVALVGASGAGKSLLSHALLGILPKNASMTGSFRFKGNPCSAKGFAKLRGKEIALIPQSVTFLNPLTKIKKQVYRSARLSGRCCCTANKCCDNTFARYRLPETVKSYLPFQISGGMARRVLTATATVSMADLIIADEPTTGLDQAVIDQSLNHLKELADEGKGILFITHDLESAMKIADTIVVVYNGKTVEVFPTAMLNSTPDILHPYTRALWNALPQNAFTPLPEEAFCPSHQNNNERLSTCDFFEFCPQSSSLCKESPCHLFQKKTHLTRCLHADS